MNEDQNNEIQKIKEELQYLRGRITYLDRRLTEINLDSSIYAEKENLLTAPKQIVPDHSDKNSSALIEKKSLKKKQKSADLEIRFGRDWLNKIGLALLVLGVGYFIQYAFKFFGPWPKIATGFFIGIVLIAMGEFLKRKDHLKKFSFGLMGGGWAVIYFTTFAMHHFQASQVMINPFLNVLCLMAVAVAMGIHVVKRQSEMLLMLAIFLGYLAATMSDVNLFTLVSCFVLSIAALSFVKIFQWSQTFFMSIGLTYVTHLIWVRQHFSADVLLLDLGFLSMYWLMFSIGIIFVSDWCKSQNQRLLSMATVINFLIYFSFAYQKVNIWYPDYSSLFVLMISAFYLTLAFLFKQHQVLFRTQLVMALFAVTLFIPLQFTQMTTLYLWFLEIPLLIYMARLSEYRFLRWGSMLLSVIAFFRFGLWEMSFFNLETVNEKMLCVWASLSMIASAVIVKIDKQKYESFISFFYQISALFYAVLLILHVFEKPLDVVALSILGLGVLSLAMFVLKDRVLSICSFAVLFVSFCLFFVRDCLFDTNQYSAIYPFSQVCLLYVSYLIYQRKQTAESIFHILMKKMLLLTVFSGVFSLSEWAPEQWLTLVLGLMSVFFFVMGFVFQDKHQRFAAVILLAVTFGRIFFVEFSHFESIHKIISFMILGVLLILVSFFYNKIFKQEGSDDHQNRLK